jgi:hypothetical protein
MLGGRVSRGMGELDYLTIVPTSGTSLSIFATRLTLGPWHKSEPYGADGDPVRGVAEVHAQRQEQRPDGRVDRSRLDVVAHRPDIGAVGPVIEEHSRRCWRILDLCQPNLADEAARVRELVAEPDADDTVVRSYLDGRLDDLVPAALGVLAERARVHDKRRQAATDPRTDSVVRRRHARIARQQ